MTPLPWLRYIFCWCQFIADMLQPAGLEGEADQEVNQIIEELTAAALAPAADAPTKKPAGPAVWMYLVLYSM